MPSCQRQFQQAFRHAIMYMMCWTKGKVNKCVLQVHVAVAGTETDHLAKLINEKAEELDASCIVMASHGKTGFQVILTLPFVTQSQSFCDSDIAIFKEARCLRFSICALLRDVPEAASN